MAQDQKKVVFLSNSSTVLEGPLKAYFLTIGFDGCLVQDLSEFDNIFEEKKIEEEIVLFMMVKIEGLVIEETVIGTKIWMKIFNL